MADARILVTGRGDFSQFERSIASARQKANAETEKIRKGFASLSSGSGLSSLAGGLVSAVAVRNVAAMADTYSNMNARLALVTKGTEDFNRVQAQLIKMAQDTRAPLTDTVDLYAQITRSTRDLGTSQEEVAEVVSNINKTLVIAPKGAEASKAAIVQLSQGFASGVLRGEEFNSVMEQTPRLAEALAAGLGVSIGQLREMAKAGELTAEKVIGALRSQTAALDAEFKRMPATLAQGIQAMSNSFTLLIGRLDQTLGITKNLAEGFQNLAGIAEDPKGKIPRLLGLDDIGELESRGKVIQNVIAATIKQIERYQALAATDNPKALAQVEKLRDALKPLNAELTEISNKLKGIIALGPAPAAVTRSDINNADRERARRDLEQAKREFAALDKTTPKEELAAKIQKIRELGLRAEATEQQIAAAVAAATPKGAGGESVFVKIQKELAELQDQLNKVDLGKTEAALLELQRKGATAGQVDAARAILDQIEARKTLRDLEQDQFDFAQERTKQQAEEAKQRADTVKSIQEQIDQQRVEISVMGQSEAVRKTAITMLEAERVGIGANTAEWFRLRDAVLASNKAHDEATRLQELIGNTATAKIAEQTADIKLLTEALQEYIATGGVSGIDQTTYLEAVTARLDLTKDKTDEAAKAAKQFGLTFQSALEDAILEGKKLSDVVNALAKDIARAFIRKSITEPLLDMFLTAGAGAAGASTGPEEFTGYVSKSAVAPRSSSSTAVKSVTVNNTYQVAAGASRADMVRAAEATENRTKADIANQMRRGNL